jgi:hypothetical protein
MITTDTVHASALVEVGGQLAGGGEHDRVESGGSVRSPSRESVFGGLGEVTDVDASLIKIEVECCRIAFAKCKGGCRFGGVGEAVELGEVEGAVGVLDVAEDAAGADGGELLIIADEPSPAGRRAVTTR